MIEFNPPRRFSGLDGDTREIRDLKDRDVEISASKRGVLISCSDDLFLQSQDDLEVLAEAIGKAWQFHQKMLKDAIIPAQDLKQLNLPFGDKHGTK